jgi:hypothetical protein
MTPSPVTDNATIVKEQSYAPADFAAVMLHLHESRATGTLCLDLRQGGVGSIRFVEERRISSDADDDRIAQSPAP